MDLRRILALGVGSLISIQVITAFLTVGLLVRISPAVEEILDENVDSNEAAEQMMAALAVPDRVGIQERFQQALQRARENVTEPEELTVLDRIERQVPDAWAGDGEARTAVLESLASLVQINRAAMQRADDEARRLGNAGAWAVVALALFGFAAGLVIAHRIVVQVLDPLRELNEVLTSFRKGDVYRRCHSPGAAREMILTLESVNLLLDELALTGYTEPSFDS